MRIRPFAIVLLLLLATSAFAAGFDRAKFAIPHQKFVLDNGLTLLVHEDHSVPVVAVNVWYHVGSRNEKPGKTGFAHLFEHFFFNGSENYPHGFREAMDDLGANNRNGTTNTDRTNFFEDVPVSALERTLYLEADRMGFLAGNISKEMLERERGVVQNEKRQGENQPYGRVFSEMVPVVYPASHPYSWSTIGSMDDLRAATLEDVKEWYATYYGPNNAVLSLAGDITPERALDLVKKYFNGIPAGPALRRAEEWIPKFERNLRDSLEDRVPQARVYRVYHAPAWRDPAIMNLSLFASVLSGSKSSPLDRRLVYDKELATNVNASTVQRELGSLFLISATVKPGIDPAVVEKEIDTVIAEVLQRGPTAEELQRAQSRGLANFVRGTERLGGFGGRSDVLAESVTYGGRPDFYLTRLEAIATATPAAVKAAANQWLTANHYTMVVKPAAPLAPGKTAVDRKTLPSLGEAPQVKFPEVQTAMLANGLKVMLLERHTAPLVNFAMVVDAGYASDSNEKLGLASLALDLVDEGTKSRDAFRIVDELDAIGARVSTGGNVDQSIVRLEALPMHLAPSLEIFADVVMSPAFPQEIFAVEKPRRLAQIRQEKASPNAMALRVVGPLLYGGSHAYGKPLTGSGEEKTVEAITRDDLAAWHRAWFHPNNSVLVVTGDVTMAQLRPELERVFGGWKRGEAPKKRLDAVTANAAGKVYLIDKPDAPQSVIVAAHVSERGGHPDDLAIETVMRNFGSMSTSRLNRNLRLEKHWSYGTSGSIFPSRGQRPFLVVAPVQTDKTKESMLEVAKEIRGVTGERPLAGEEFASIMRNQTMRLPGRFETLASLESAALEMINLGRKQEYFRDYATNVRSLTEARLAEAGKKFVKPDQLVWLVVGDLKKIEAGVRELKFGEVVKLEQ